MKKRIQYQLPDYLTIGQYQTIEKYKDSGRTEFTVQTVSSLTKYEPEEVRKWDVTSLKKILKSYEDISFHNNEFHSLIEWNGELLGYSHIRNQSLGEYVDLENLCEDVPTNLHKICAIMYRPIKKHRFKSFEFAIKQGLKMVKNKVENVFDWYELKPYDSKERKMREESFKDFPVHIILGALSFFLSTAHQYLINTQSSDNQKVVKMINRLQEKFLSQTIGRGGGLSTSYLNPTYLQLQEIKRSPILT